MHGPGGEGHGPGGEGSGESVAESPLEHAQPILGIVDFNLHSIILGSMADIDGHPAHFGNCKMGFQAHASCLEVNEEPARGWHHGEQVVHSSVALFGSPSLPCMHPGAHPITVYDVAGGTKHGLWGSTTALAPGHATSNLV